ncbi:MAG: hypothetical protein ABSF71_20245 [Terriglobia bacterium]|jgi:hypothetical protein
MPDTAPYLDRIRSFAAGKDPLALQRETPEVIPNPSIAALGAKRSSVQSEK